MSGLKNLKTPNPQGSFLLRPYYAGETTRRTAGKLQALTSCSQAKGRRKGFGES